MKDNPIRTHLEDGLSALCVTERRHREMLDSIVYGRKTKMKRKLSFTLILAVALLLMSITGALAATGALEKLLEVWQSSFEKMNTTGMVDITNEEEYAQLLEDQEMKEAKEDYVVSTVPRTGDLGYDEAYAIARQAILDTFGTPEDELDAMGVYPSFYNTPYMDESEDEELYINEWEFYFTPRHDVDIDADHTYEAPGEYRVWIASPSGEVTNIIWYLDDFWPDYALRALNAGKYDYVYKKALRGYAFYQQPREQQEMFRKLFAEAGYDAKALNKDVATLLNETQWFMLTEDADNLLDADTPAVRAVVEAVEKEYGFTLDRMKECCYRLLPSPLPSDTEDYCLIFDHNLIYREVQSAENPTGGVGRYELEIIRYLRRLGYFLVRLDPETHEAVEIIHAPWTNTYGTANYSRLDAQIPESDKLLGRKQWTLADLEEFEQLRQKVVALDENVANGTLPKEQGDELFLTLMREAGWTDNGR